MLQPPADFQLKRVQQLSMQPKPIPLTAAEIKAEIEKKREQKPADTFAMFERVDKHALDVSRVEHKNFRHLIWALIYARNINDDLEKVRCARATRWQPSVFFHIKVGILPYKGVFFLYSR